MLDISKKIIGGSSMVVGQLLMLILPLWTPRLLLFMPHAAQFPPPPPPYVAPSYGFDAFGAWMFDQHVGDVGQGTSGQGGRNDDEDDDQQ